MPCEENAKVRTNVPVKKNRAPCPTAGLGVRQMALNVSDRSGANHRAASGDMSPATRHRPRPRQLAEGSAAPTDQWPQPSRPARTDGFGLDGPYRPPLARRWQDTARRIARGCDCPLWRGCRSARHFGKDGIAVLQMCEKSCDCDQGALCETLWSTQCLMILVQNTVAQRETLRVSTLGSQLLARVYPKPTILVTLLPEFPKLPGTGNHPRRARPELKENRCPKARATAIVK